MKSQVSMDAYLDFTFGDTDYNITIDTEELSEFVNDAYKFSESYHEGKEQLDQQFAQDLYNAYKTAIAKIYLDYGETFTPLYEAYAEVLDSSKVDTSQCDTDCFFENCYLSSKFYYKWDAQKGYYIYTVDPTKGMQYSCLSNCGCKMNETYHHDALENLED